MKAEDGLACRAKSSRLGRLMWTRAERTCRRVPMDRASSPSIARWRLMLACTSRCRRGLPVEQLVADGRPDRHPLLGQAHAKAEDTIGRDHDGVTAGTQPIRHAHLVQALDEALAIGELEPGKQQRVIRNACPPDDEGEEGRKRQSHPAQGRDPTRAECPQEAQGTGRPLLRRGRPAVPSSSALALASMSSPAPRTCREAGRGYGRLAERMVKSAPAGPPAGRRAGPPSAGSPAGPGHPDGPSRAPRS